MKTTIRTIDELVDFFGGDTALAEMLGISQSAVAYWKIRQQIASGWHLRLVAELQRRRQPVHPSVFGLTEEEAGELFQSKNMTTGRRALHPAA